MDSINVNNLTISEGGYLYITPAGGTITTNGCFRKYNRAGVLIEEILVDGEWQEVSRKEK